MPKSAVEEESHVFVSVRYMTSRGQASRKEGNPTTSTPKDTFALEEMLLLTRIVAFF